MHVWLTWSRRQDVNYHKPLLWASTSPKVSATATTQSSQTRQKPMCHFNLGNLMDVQERHITNRICRDFGVQWEMTVGIGGVCSLTSEVLANLTKGMPPPAYFDWRGWFRAGLRFFQGDMRCSTLMDLDRRRPLLPNLTYPEYPVTPEAGKRFLQD
ncbi:hypothetical protein J6590_048242 [Homalodisca vitripennis]|nr:hypothetical protein J6590_048242 [Homalodisca vitripennis]